MSNINEKEIIIERIEKFLGDRKTINNLDKYQRNKFNFILDTNCVTTVDSKINLFIRLDKFHLQEIIRKKDLYEMNTAELQEVLNSTAVASSNEQSILFYALKKYIEYQMDRGEILTNISPLISLSPKDIAIAKRLLSTKYITEEQLYDLMDNNNIRIKNLFDDYKGNATFALTKEVIIRAESLLISLLYSGVMGEKLSELCNLTVEDLDFKNKKIMLENNILDMHDSVETNYYNYINAIEDYNTSAANTSRLGRCIDRGYVFRTMENEVEEKYNNQRIQRYIKDCKEETRYCRITPLTVKNSGIFNYLWNVEQERKEELTEREIIDILENKYKETAIYKKYNLAKLYKDYKIAKIKEITEDEELRRLQEKLNIEL